MSPFASVDSVQFHPLSANFENPDEVIVGRSDIGEFVGVPPLAWKAIELLQNGLGIAQTSQRLEEQTGQSVDVGALVEGLAELGFVSRIGGREFDSPAPRASHLELLKPRHVAWLFAWPAKLIFVVLVVVAGATLLQNPELRPSYEHFFWSRYNSLNVAINTAIFLIAVAAHELFHLVAARSLGIPGRIGLGTRLTNLVAQT